MTIAALTRRALTNWRALALGGTPVAAGLFIVLGAAPPQADALALCAALIVVTLILAERVAVVGAAVARIDASAGASTALGAHLLDRVSAFEADSTALRHDLDRLSADLRQADDHAAVARRDAEKALAAIEARVSQLKSGPDGVADFFGLLEATYTRLADLFGRLSLMEGDLARERERLARVAGGLDDLRRGSPEVGRISARLDGLATDLHDLSQQVHHSARIEAPRAKSVT